MSELDRSKDSLANKIADEVNENSEKGMSLIKRMIPLLILLILAVSLWIFFNKGCRKDELTANSVSSSSLENTKIDSNKEGVDSLAMSTKVLWENTLGKMTSLSLPSGISINIPENGFEKKLIEFIENGCKGDLKATWFNCDRLLFKTGSEELNPISMEQIQVLSEIFKAYPNAKFKIGGYTDNSGNPESNLKLSASRATAVMNAIIANGVASEKLKAEGYGSKYPECPANDTEECKAKNRRVSIRVEQCK